MNLPSVFDTAYKLISVLFSLGIFGIMVKVSIQIGNWQQWVKTIDKEVASHGTMLQQVTVAVSRIEGRMEEGSKGMDRKHG